MEPRLRSTPPPQKKKRFLGERENKTAATYVPDEKCHGRGTYTTRIIARKESKINGVYFRQECGLRKPHHPKKKFRQKKVYLTNLNRGTRQTQTRSLGTYRKDDDYAAKKKNGVYFPMNLGLRKTRHSEKKHFSQKEVYQVYLTTSIVARVRLKKNGHISDDLGVKEAPSFQKKKRQKEVYLTTSARSTGY